MTARTMLAACVAVAAGVAIAFVDSRQGHDATAITIGLLVVAAGAAAIMAGRWPVLWGALVGIWVPLMELPQGGSTGSLAALAFAVAGALAASMLARRDVMSA